MSGQKELRYEGKGWKFAMRPGQLRGLCCTSKIGEGIVKSRQWEASQEMFP
jgi:hypothetical protein